MKPIKPLESDYQGTIPLGNSPLIDNPVMDYLSSGIEKVIGGAGRGTGQFINSAVENPAPLVAGALGSAAVSSVPPAALVAAIVRMGLPLTPELVAGLAGYAGYQGTVNAQNPGISPREAVSTLPQFMMKSNPVNNALGSVLQELITGQTPSIESTVSSALIPEIVGRGAGAIREAVPGGLVEAMNRPLGRKGMIKLGDLYRGREGARVPGWKQVNGSWESILGGDANRVLRDGGIINPNRYNRPRTIITHQTDNTSPLDNYSPRIFNDRINPSITDSEHLREQSGIVLNRYVIQPTESTHLEIDTNNPILAPENRYRSYPGVQMREPIRSREGHGRPVPQNLATPFVQSTEMKFNQFLGERGTGTLDPRNNPTDLYRALQALGDPEFQRRLIPEEKPVALRLIQSLRRLQRGE